MKNLRGKVSTVASITVKIFIFFIVFIEFFFIFWNSTIFFCIFYSIFSSFIDGKISNILYPGSGTFNYRLISGTNRLSPHSFGIAIDLKSDKKDYWKWSSKENGEKRINEYPEELVKVFEENNFIWGGKWGYFDILHFEYRPEIILKAKFFSEYDENNKWYEGAPTDDEYTKKCIEIIENALE